MEKETDSVTMAHRNIKQIIHPKLRDLVASHYRHKTLGAKMNDFLNRNSATHMQRKPYKYPLLQHIPVCSIGTALYMYLITAPGLHLGYRTPPVCRTMYSRSYPPGVESGTSRSRNAPQPPFWRPTSFTSRKSY